MIYKKRRLPAREIIEIFLELADTVDFMDAGCPVFNHRYRFNIRIKTINYDG
jgi:hypothetical protein